MDLRRRLAELPLPVNPSSEGSYCWASSQLLSCTPRLLADLWESENEHKRVIPATNEIFCQSGKNESNCHQTQFPVRIFWMEHSILICSRIPPKELTAPEASCPCDFPLTVSQYQRGEAAPVSVFSLINIIITGQEITCYHFQNSRCHITFVIFFMLMPCDNKK